MDDDDFFKRISDFEQAAANFGQLATFIGAYHRNLCESGFNRDESLELVKNLQKTLFDKCFAMSSPNNKNDYDNDL